MQLLSLLPMLQHWYCPKSDRAHISDLLSWSVLVIEGHNWCTLAEVPIVTNANFLLTISIQCQAIRLWQLINWSPKGKCPDLLSNFLNSFMKEMYGDQFWRICMWILLLKGLMPQILHFPLCPTAATWCLVLSTFVVVLRLLQNLPRTSSWNR